MYMKILSCVYEQRKFTSPFFMRTMRQGISFGSDILTIGYYDKTGSKQREDIVFEQTINQRNRFLDAVSIFSGKKHPEVLIF